MEKFVIAVDQGTTSTRAIIFNESGEAVSTSQMEHKQIMSQAGWVEHDAMEIWNNAREVVGQALGRANITRHSIAAVGITNQRETTVIWDKKPAFRSITHSSGRTLELSQLLTPWLKTAVSTGSGT